jgi:hypothetical protein
MLHNGNIKIYFGENMRKEVKLRVHNIIGKPDLQNGRKTKAREEEKYLNEGFCDRWYVSQCRLR